MDIKKFNTFPNTKGQTFGRAKTYEWLSSDTPEQFKKQSVKHQNYWNAQEKITYDINEYGFRCDSFLEEECRESITFIGCSNTVGIGMNKEKTWTTMVAKQLGLKEINLGISSGSLDSAFRVYNEWQPIFKSKYTVLFEPPTNRIEISDVYETRWRAIGNWCTPEVDPDILPELLVCLIGEKTGEVNRARNIAAIKHIAEQTNSTLIIKSLKCSEIQNNVAAVAAFKTARDGIHSGEEFHTVLKDIIVKELKAKDDEQ